MATVLEASVAAVDDTANDQADGSHSAVDAAHAHAQGDGTGVENQAHGSDTDMSPQHIK